MTAPLGIVIGLASIGLAAALKEPYLSARKRWAKGFQMYLKGAQIMDENWALSWLDFDVGEYPPELPSFDDHYMNLLTWRDSIADREFIRPPGVRW